MIYSKLPISIADQIALMKRRGLIVGDELEAERELRVISYFRLADYLTPLEADKVTHRFKAGATLDDALRLYYFDKELKALLRKYPSVDVAAMGFPEGWDEEPLWKDKESTSDEDAGSDAIESDESVSDTEASAEVQSTDAASEEVADGETASDVSTDGEASDKE